MPLFLRKLYGITQEFDVPLVIDDEIETIHCVWSPARYSGEMDELAEELVATNEDADDETFTLEDEAVVLRANGNERAAALKERAAGRMRKAKARRDMRHLRKLLSTVLVSWDVLDDDGQPVPTTEAQLRKFPDFFVNAVFLALSAENRADPTKAPNSDASSSTPASSEPSPTGTASSEPPTTSASLPGSSSPTSSEPDITRSGEAGPS